MYVKELGDSNFIANDENVQLQLLFLSQKGGGYGTMISGFTTVEGLLSLTDTQLNSLTVNAKRSCENKASLEFIHRVSNQEVSGLLDLGAMPPTALTFSYCFLNMVRTGVGIGIAKICLRKNILGKGAGSYFG